MRNNKTLYSVLVHQHGGIFTFYSKEQIHGNKPRILNAMQMTQWIIAEATENFFVPDPTIVKRVMEEMTNLMEPEFARPKSGEQTDGGRKIDQRNPRT